MKIRTYLKKFLFLSTFLTLLSVSNSAFSEETSPETTGVNPQVQATPKEKSSKWINNSINNLNKNGVLKVPDWVDYDSLVSQKDFAVRNQATSSSGRSRA